MRTCPNCSARVPHKKVIEGKLRCLRNRKFCLTCSPFKAHASLPIHRRGLLKDEDGCKSCGRPSRHKDGRLRRLCPYCSVKAYRQRVKKRAVEYKGGACVRCGYSKCIRALEFHHQDPSRKEFSIAGTHIGWKRLRVELDKCDLVCSNCHAEIEEELDSPSSITVMQSDDNRPTTVQLSSRGPENLHLSFNGQDRALLTR